ncbi:MAG: molybdopterin-containing oxidoreductase family protein [Promethearchaeota archaeon]
MGTIEEVKIIRTACPQHCGIDCCGILAHVKNNKVIKLEPADFPYERDRRICLRGLSSLDITYHPERLKFPMKRTGERGGGKFKRISWNEAYDIIVSNFTKISEKYGWKSIGWVLGGPGAGTTKFGVYLRLASLTQSTRVSSWGYGDAGLPCGSRVILGHQFPYLHLHGTFWQRKWPDLLIAWGTNPAESMPLHNMRKIMDAKEEGTQFIVVDPRFTITASKADEYIGLKPGTDSALTLGIMNVIFNNNLHDKKFIAEHTNGPYLVRSDTGKFLREKDIEDKKSDAYLFWHEQSKSHKKVRRKNVMEASLTGTFEVNGIKCKPVLQLLMDLASEYTPEQTAEITGISQELVVKLAKRIGNANDVIFLTHNGFTRTYHGDISLRGVISVAAITGNVTTEVTEGYIPATLNWKPFLKAIPDKPSYHRLGILNLYDAVIKGEPYPIKAVWFSFINFLNQCANSNKIIEEFFPNLDFIVQTELFMTPSAKYADLILPVCSFLEFSDFMFMPYPYLQLQQKVIEPLYESKSDVTIASELAERLGFGNYFKGGEEGMIDMILDNPSLTGVTREKLKDKALRLRKLPDGGSFPLNFGTPSGKIELYAEQLVEDGEALPVYLSPIEAPETAEKGKEGKYPLAFIQGHSRFHTHSTFANVDSLLELNPEPLVEINPIDAENRKIADNDYVTVFNDRAKTTLKARVTESVSPGVINITEGWWINQFKEGSVNHLTHDIINPVQEKVYEPNMHFNDVAVEIVKHKEV